MSRVVYWCGRFDREIAIGVPDEVGLLEVLRIHTKNMKLAEDLNCIGRLREICKDTLRYVGAYLAALCTESALRCIREKMDVIDLEEMTQSMLIYLNSMVVTNEHFETALGTSNPSALRETVVKVSNVSWQYIRGLMNVKREFQQPWDIECLEKYNESILNISSIWHVSFKRVLFYVPPGCGQTLLAKAIAMSAKQTSSPSRDLSCLPCGLERVRPMCVRFLTKLGNFLLVSFSLMNLIPPPRGKKNASLK